MIINKESKKNNNRCTDPKIHGWTQNLPSEFGKFGISVQDFLAVQFDQLAAVPTQIFGPCWEVKINFTKNRRNVRSLHATGCLETTDAWLLEIFDPI